MSVTHRSLRMGPSGQWLVIAACAAFAVLSAVQFFAGGDREPVRGVLHIASFSVSFLLAGAVLWIRRPDNRLGLLLLGVSIAASLSFWGRFPAPIAGQIAGLAGSVSNVLIVWIAFAAPSGHVGSRLGRWLVVAFAAVLAAITVNSLLGPNLDLLRVTFAFGVACSLGIAAVIMRRWLRATPASRRSLTPVVIAGVTISLVHAVDFTAGVFLVPVLPGSPIYWADTLSRLLVPFGFVAGALRLRLARGALADLVVDLGSTPAPGRLRQALAGALGDPELRVLYWSPDLRAYADPNGLPVDPDVDKGERTVTYLEREGEPLAALVHDPALSEDPGLVAAVAAAVRLAVDNERLTFEVEAQLDEVRASRVRIVEAGDAERRRVERDLHDGAQQRIVSMALALRLAQAKLSDDADPALRASLEQASAEAKAALAELRELARGIHPQILTEAGLTAAVETLAGRSPVDVTVELEISERFPATVEGTAYFVVSEALANVAKYAQATSATIRGGSADGLLTIEVEDDGIGGADPKAGSGLRGLTDRLSAVDGTLEVVSPLGGGTRVRATIPVRAAVPS